jgi:tRNA U34 5-carboxymethylaminomethyl modifying enzyme MnmG/GidA
MSGEFLRLILVSIVSVASGYYLVSLIYRVGSGRDALKGRIDMFVKVFFIISSLCTGYYMASIVMPTRTRVDVTSIDYAVVDVDPGYHLIFLGFVMNNGISEAHDVEVWITWTDPHGESHTGSRNMGSLAPRESRYFEVVFTYSRAPVISSYSQSVTFTN